METQTNTNQVTITRQEAEEYCTYKRQKKIAEIMSAMHCGESVFNEGEDVEKFCERSMRLRQIAVRMSPLELMRYRVPLQKHGVQVDCIVGGNGETFSKVKIYEGKKALQMGAKELSVVLAPSHLIGSRYTELKKELKKLRRSLRKTTLKIRLERNYPQATLSRAARLVSECGAEYLSIPYFVGCERVLADLFGGCQLEVSGVETLADFKKMTGAGIRRVLTSHAWEIYSSWLEEVEKITVGKELPMRKQEEEKTQKSPVQALAKPLLLPVAKTS